MEIEHNKRPKWLCDYVWELRDEEYEQIELLKSEYDNKINTLILSYFDNIINRGEIFIRNEKEELEFLKVEDDKLVFRLCNCDSIIYKPEELIGTLELNGKVFL